MLKTFMDLFLHCDAHLELGILDRARGHQMKPYTGDNAQCLLETQCRHRSTLEYTIWSQNKITASLLNTSNPNWGDSQYDISSSTTKKQQQNSFNTPNNTLSARTHLQAQSPTTGTNSGQQQTSNQPTGGSPGVTGNNQGSGNAGVSNNNSGGSGMTQIQRMKTFHVKIINAKRKT